MENFIDRAWRCYRKGIKRGFEINKSPRLYLPCHVMKNMSCRLQKQFQIWNVLLQRFAALKYVTRSVSDSHKYVYCPIKQNQSKSIILKIYKQK